MARIMKNARSIIGRISRTPIGNLDLHYEHTPDELKIPQPRQLVIARIILRPRYDVVMERG